MSLISDIDYLLHSIRLTALQNTEDAECARIITLDPSFSLNPFINEAGLADLDRWPEIKRALDSPPLEREGLRDDRPRRRRNSVGVHGTSNYELDQERKGKSAGGGGLNYTQTIMGGRSGGAGMRVTGRRGKNRRPSTSDGRRMSVSPELLKDETGSKSGSGQFALDELGQSSESGLARPPRRPRSDSAPIPQLIPPAAEDGKLGSNIADSMLNPARTLGLSRMESGMGYMESALSQSDLSEIAGRDEGDTTGGFGHVTSPDVGMDMSARPALPNAQDSGRLGEGMLDEGSDVDEDEIEEEEGDLDDVQKERRASARKSTVAPPRPGEDEQLSFAPVPILTLQHTPKVSTLTSALNKHIPHLVSTASAPAAAATQNPFSSLYASVAAPASAQPISLDLYFPHSSSPSTPIQVKVRKDATVEEVTGHGLLRYWNDGREPKLSEEESDQRWSTVGWGLRIVEDDGEVDDDFPPLDRESRISKFSYGQFAIVEATSSQIKQNLAKAPHIARRQSRILGVQSQAQAQRPQEQRRPSVDQLSTSLSSAEQLNAPAMATSALKGSVGLSSALSKTVLLRIKIAASMDVHFTTTISVPSDMYIADLTEVLCKKKRLQMPSSDWVLCLEDLSLALPLDRTVASLEGRTNLSLVRRHWAIEHGLRIGDRRGGDPSASIFKRLSEPPSAKTASNADFTQTYKKYHVQRKIAIGRHPRILAIDGDYIHIMPSESRAFFDSMKTTSFHISLVVSCKPSGRYGGFKINVWRDGAQKRYEFEADSNKQATEIISSIRALMKQYQTERGSMLPPPRTAYRR